MLIITVSSKIIKLKDLGFSQIMGVRYPRVWVADIKQGRKGQKRKWWPERGHQGNPGLRIYLLSKETRSLLCASRRSQGLGQGNSRNPESLEASQNLACETDSSFTSRPPLSSVPRSSTPTTWLLTPDRRLRASVQGNHPMASRS